MLDIGGVGFPDPDEKKKNAMLDAKVFTGPPTPPAPMQQPRPPGAMLDASSFTSQSPYIVPPRPGMLWQNNQFGYGGQWQAQQPGQPNFNVADVPANVPLLQQNAPAGYLPMQTRSDIPPDSNVLRAADRVITKAGDLWDRFRKADVSTSLTNLSYPPKPIPSMNLGEYWDAQLQELNRPYEEAVEPIVAKPYNWFFPMDATRKANLERQAEIKRRLQQSSVEQLTQVNPATAYREPSIAGEPSALYPETTGMLPSMPLQPKMPVENVFRDNMQAELSKLQVEDARITALNFLQGLGTYGRVATAPPIAQSFSDVIRQFRAADTSASRKAAYEQQNANLIAATEMGGSALDIVKGLVADDSLKLRATPAGVETYRANAPAWVQLFANIALDPLNIVDFGLDIISKEKAVARAWRKYAVVEDTAQDAVEVLTAMGDKNRKWWAWLNPRRQLPESQATATIKNAIDVFSGMERDMGESFTALLPALIRNPDDPYILARTSNYSGSRPVKEAVGMLTRVIGSNDVADVAKYLNRHMTAAQGNFDEVLVRMLGDIEKEAYKIHQAPVRPTKSMSVQDILDAGLVPDTSLYGKAKHIRDSINHRLSLMYMGWTVPFPIRNVASNTSQMITDFVLPSLTTSGTSDFIKGWGRKTVGAGQGMGFASQVTGKSTQAIRETVENLGKATTGKDVISQAKRWKEGPGLLTSATLEQIGGERIYTETVRRTFPQIWKPVVKDLSGTLRKAGFPEETVVYLNSRLRSAVSQQEIDEIIEFAIDPHGLGPAGTAAGTLPTTPPAGPGSVGGPQTTGPVTGSRQTQLPGMPPAAFAGGNVATPPSSPWPRQAAPTTPLEPLIGPPAPPIFTPPGWGLPTVQPPTATVSRPRRQIAVIKPELMSALEGESPEMAELLRKVTKDVSNQAQLDQAVADFTAFVETHKGLHEMRLAAQALGTRATTENFGDLLTGVMGKYNEHWAAHRIVREQTFARSLAISDKPAKRVLWKNHWDFVHASQSQIYKEIDDIVTEAGRNIGILHDDLMQFSNHLKEDIAGKLTYIDDHDRVMVKLDSIPDGATHDRVFREQMKPLEQKEAERAIFAQAQFTDDIKNLTSKIPPRGGAGGGAAAIAAQPSPASAVAGPPPPATAPSLIQPVGPALPQAVVGTQVASGFDKVSQFMPRLEEKAKNAINARKSPEAFVGTLNKGEFAGYRTAAKSVGVSVDPVEYYKHLQTKVVEALPPASAVSTGTGFFDDLTFDKKPPTGKDTLFFAQGVQGPHNPISVAKDAMDSILERIRQVPPRLAELDSLTPIQAAELRRLREEKLLPELLKRKAVADNVGVQMRNFTLLDYSDRRMFNEALQWVFPYNKWFVGTYTNWLKRMAQKPAFLKHYLETRSVITEANRKWYRELMNDPEAEMPEWYEGQLRVPFFGMLDIEKTINPMYNLLTTFNPKERSEAPGGKLLEAISGWGPSVWTPFVAGLSGYWASIGEKDAAAQAFGYVTPLSKPLKYATAMWKELNLPGSGLIPPGGFTFEGLFGVPHTIVGGDIWERKQQGYFLARQWLDGEITAEKMEEVGNSKTGPEWDKAVQMQAVYKATPGLLNFLLAMSFKPTTDLDVLIDKMWNDWGNLLDQKDTMTPEAWQQALIDFDDQYVWARAVRMSRELDPKERLKDYGYLVLQRLPPGEERSDFLKSLGVSELVDRFYANKGDVTDWSEQDVKAISLAFDKIGGRYNIPTPLERKEFNKAKENHARIKDEAVDQLLNMGYDQAPWIETIQENYYAEGVDKPAYLEQWPILPMYWDLQRGVTDDNVDLKATEEEFYTSENERLNTEFWEEQLPPGSNWRKGLDLPPFVQAMLDEDSRPLLDEKEKQVAVDWLKANVPSAFKDLDEWPMAKRLNDQFREQVTAALGENVFELSALYGEMKPNEKAGWKKDYPNQYAELELYWDAKTAYGQKYPLWRKYYGFADEIPKSSPASTSASAGRGRGGGGGRGISQSVAAALPGTPTPLAQQSQVQPGTDYDALAAQVSTIMDDPGFISLVTKLFKTSFMLLLRRWLKMTPAERAAWALKNRADWHRIQAFLTWFMKQAQTGSPAADAGRIVQSVPRNAPVAPPLAAP